MPFIEDSRGGRGLTSHGETAQDSVAAQFGKLAREIEAAPDLLATLQAITTAATVNIPGAQYAGITLVSGRKVTTPAASDELVRVIDRMQYESGQGPCLSAIREHATVRSNDLARDDRWPDFAARAAHLGVRSMLAFQLFVRDHDLGALNLYSRERNGFSEEAEGLGLVLAVHCAIALVGAQREQSLLAAVSSRDIIGQAKGILMERHKITAQQAFDRLVHASSRTNRRLVDIAEKLADTGIEP